LTVIVGFIDTENRIQYMGADTMLSACSDAVNSRHEKIFNSGSYLVGHTGSPRANQIIRYVHKFPRYTKRWSDDTTGFMCSKVVPGLMAALIEHGYAKNDCGHFEMEDIFMMMFAGKIYSIWADFQVFEPTTNFFAVGSGAQIALGSMMASADMGLDAEERILLAVESSIEYSTNVGGECMLLSRKY